MSISDRVAVLHKSSNIGAINTAKGGQVCPDRNDGGQAGGLGYSPRADDRGRRDPGCSQALRHRGGRPAELQDVSFRLHAGEILGVAGVAGSGQRALCEAIAGLQAISGGSILMDGKRIDGLSPREIIKRGVSMAFIREDRLGMGLVGSMNIPDNLLLKTYRDQQGLFLDRKSARERAGN